MAISSWIDDNCLRRGYALAQPAHSDWDVACSVVADAIQALETRTAKVDKSLIERLKGGHKPVRPIAVEAPLLQRLILEKSDEYARKEADHELCAETEERMLARYLDCLVLRTLQASSRWAAVGISQLVYSYHGSQVDEMVSCVVRREWDEKNRKQAKKDLMEYLKNRFSGLELVPARDGLDRHFEPSRNQSRFQSRVSDLLKTLIPWGAEEHVLQEASNPYVAPYLNEDLLLTQKQHNPLASNIVELNRYHVFLDPLCFAHLITALAPRVGPLPDECLRVPQLRRCRAVGDSDDSALNGGGSMDFTSEPDIDPAQRIRAKVKTQDERRRKTSARSFKIRVDGSLAGVLAGPSAVVEVPLPSHANLIQVYGNSNSNEEVLLATHILTHNEHGGLTPSAGSVTLGLRHRFSFTVPIHDDRSFDNTTAVCCVRHSSVMLILPSLSIHAPAYAALFAIFVCGWVTSLVWRPGLNGKTQTLETELGHARTERNEALRQLELIQGGIPPVELRRLQAGGDRGSRSPEKDRLSGIQELVVPNTPRIMTLNLPLPTTDAVSFRATLQTFESSRDLLAQTGLTAMRINGHLVVQWKVSSTVFGTSGGYVVQLFNESENAAEPRVIARFGLWVGKN